MPRKLAFVSVPLVLALALALAVVPATAQRQTYMFGGVDLVDPAEITVPANRPDVSREPVTFTWALDPAQEINKDEPTYPTAFSRQYWLRVTPEELRAGVALPTTAAGALVRLQTFDAGGKAHAADVSSLRVTTPSGAELDSAAAMALLVDAEQLDAMQTFQPGTAAFRLRAELGAGDFVISGDVSGNASGDDPGADIDAVLIHVFEPQSDVVLALRADQGHFLHKNVARFTVELQANGLAAVEQIDAFLSAPSGNAWPVTFSAKADGSYSARLPLDASGEAGYDGLWQIEAVVEGDVDGQRVRRAAHTAFAVALPTARVMDVERQLADGVRKLAVNVEVAVAGRYEVRGVLYGTDSEGQLRPLAMTHSAAWLEPGFASLPLSFDAEGLQHEGFGAPYEVRDLRLLDQGRMSLLRYQPSGLSLQ